MNESESVESSYQEDENSGAPEEPATCSSTGAGEEEIIRIPRPRSGDGTSQSANTVFSSAIHEEVIRIPRPQNGHGTSGLADPFSAVGDEVIRIPRPRNGSHSLSDDQAAPKMKDYRGVVLGTVIPVIIVLAIVLYQSTTNPVYPIILAIATIIGLRTYWNAATEKLRKRKTPPMIPFDDEVKPFPEFNGETTITDLGTEYAICPYCNSEDRKIYPGDRDVVKCRITGCGAVHHRDCWEANHEQCANLTNHCR